MTTYKSINNEDYKYMKKFFKIKLNVIAKKLKLDRSYLGAGGYPEEKYKLVRKEIEKEIAKLYLGK